MTEIALPTRLSRLTALRRRQETGRAHGEVLGAIRPAQRLVHVRPFSSPKSRVAIERVAVQGSA